MLSFLMHFTMCFSRMSSEMVGKSYYVGDEADVEKGEQVLQDHTAHAEESLGSHLFV